MGLKSIKILLTILLVVAMPATVFADVNIVSQAAVVIDFETGEVLFERDAHSRRAPASMTKNLTAFIVYEEIAAGNLTLDTMIRVSPFASQISATHDQRLPVFPLRAGSYHSVDTMLHLIMLPSSNGASVAVAEHISGSESAFAERMNETGRSLGMYADFGNSHGALPTFTNAYSMGRLVYEFIHRYPDILRITEKSSFVMEGHTINNTNLFLHSNNAHYFPEVDGFKTGTTALAGHCLSSTAVRDGRRIVVVTMNAAGNPGRYGDSRTLLNFGFEEAARRAANRLSVTIGGNILEFDTAPQLIDGRAMVPMRTVFEALNASIEWDDATQTVTAHTSEGNVIVLSVGSNIMYKDGIPTEIDVLPQIIDSRVLVPTRVVAEATARRVIWDEETRTVMIEPFMFRSGHDVLVDPLQS